MIEPKYFVYILQCGDDSLYCGVALDVLERLEKHQAGKGAKYTRGRGPLLLAGTAGPFQKETAFRIEMAIKSKPKHRKLEALKIFQRVKGISGL